MPLISGSSREAISKNIEELVRHNHSREQAVAIALSKAGQSRDAVAAGVMMEAPDGDILFVRRSAKGDHAGEWAFPGGHIETGETPQQAAARETLEEIGYAVDPETLGQLIGVSGDFNTYHLPVREKITPQLNDEHTEYQWANPALLPGPLHSGVLETMLLAVPGAAVSPEYEPTEDAITLDRGYFAPTLVGKTRKLMPNGSLVCEGVGIARTGIQLYNPQDLPKLEPGPDGKITVERLPEEVFHPDTIASFEAAPVTIYHPREFVNPENWKQVSIGHVQNVRQGEGEQSDLLLGDIIIQDAAGVHYAINNMPDISCGYDAKYPASGTAPGKYYQRLIRGNHAALVPNGRAGDRCAIQDHSTSEDFSLMSKSTVATAIASFFKGKGMPDAAAVELQNLVGPLATTDAREDDDKDDKKVMDAISQLSKDMQSVRDWQKARDAAEKEEEDKQKAKDAAEEEEKKKEAAKEKTGDTLIEAEETGKVIDLGKVWTGTTGDAMTCDAIMTEIRSRAEVIAPGMSVPTTDAIRGNQGAVLSNFLRTALTVAQTQDAALVEPFLLGHKIPALRGAALLGAFNGVYGLKKIRNNASTRSIAGGLRTQDGKGGGISRMIPSNAAAAYAANLAKHRKAGSGTT